MLNCTTLTASPVSSERVLTIKYGNKEMPIQEYLDLCFDNYRQRYNPEFNPNIRIKDVTVYGKPDPRVVELLIWEREDECIRKTKVKAICDKEDVFDLEKGIYIAIIKYLYGNTLTPTGIEEFADKLKLYTFWNKKVQKAIKLYNDKLKTKEKEQQTKSKKNKR